MAPLIDCVFLLLIFFMLVTRFLSPSIAVALPESGRGAVEEAKARTVAIDRDGMIYLDDRPMSLSGVSAALAAAKEAGEIDLVRLRADRETAFQVIVDALEAIRAGGIVDIAIEVSGETEAPSDE
jgi:biopolymer transport protein ExbD